MTEDFERDPNQTPQDPSQAPREEIRPSLYSQPQQRPYQAAPQQPPVQQQPPMQQQPMQQQPMQQPQPVRNPYYGYQAPQPPQPPRPPKRSVWPAVLTVSFVWLAVLVLIVFVSFYPRTGANTATEPKTGESGASETVPASSKNPAVTVDRTSGYTGEALPGAVIYENNVECVVFVQATTSSGTALGSGFIIDAQNGYILTNNHIISGATSATVTLKNSEEEIPAQIIGGDPVTDVGVLKIEAEGLKQVTLGDSDKMKIGNDLYIIGHPLGTLVDSCTKGIVSGLNRDLPTETEYVVNVFQTDAAINGGNSGGPAFDPSGAVVGIASAKYAATGVEALCFCIPINEAMAAAEDLIEFGYVKGRANFGISVSTAPGYVLGRDQFGRLSYQRTVAGALIEQVFAGSAAEKAGLKAGDVVTKLNDVEITTAMNLINAKNKYKPGDTVTLTVYRSGETLKLDLTFDEYAPN